MSFVIDAQVREKKGRQAKQVLHENRIPAIAYGQGEEGQALSVARSEFVKVLRGAGFSSLVDVSLDGSAPAKMLIKAIQRNPVTHDIIHVDFYRVRMDREMTATVPITFVGESAAVKTLGGTLVKALDEVEISCLPKDLPHDVQVDIARLATFEDALTVGDIQMPDGVTLKSDPTMTVATVARPLTEDELKKMDESGPADVSSIKTEGEEKKAADAAKKAAEDAMDAAK